MEPREKIFGALNKKFTAKFVITPLPVLFTILLYGQTDSVTNGNAQQSIVKEEVPIIMAAGKQFKASGWKRLWWGTHYRREWATPVAFPVLKMNEFEGGLTPYEAGGGHESKSLRLLAGNGKEYVLRTIDKSLDLIVPVDFRGTFINDIVNDQISTAHPYGPIAISSLAGSLSLLHTHPKIYYVPDDPALKEFRPVFANKLCLLEERPSGKGWAHTAEFGNAEDIVNSEKLFTRVFESSVNTIDQRSFLSVRLFDIIVNDWDRHEDQWVWATKKENGHKSYFAIGRDRDQAFSKTDGISLYILSRRYAYRALQSMHTHVRDMRGTTFSARNLDRQFLNGLTKEDWKSSIEFIQSHLTDSAIKLAIYSMPKEVNKISGDFLIKRLGQRRDNLMKDGMRYYDIESKQIYINGSEDNEKFIIGQHTKNEISVTGLRNNTDTFYNRTFSKGETKEINIYGLGGNDQFVVNGDQKNRFNVRLIGGEGQDDYISTGEVPAGKHYKVYDSLFTSKPDGTFFKMNRRWDTIYRYRRISSIYDWYLPLVIPAYNADDGFMVGAGLLYKRQQWGKTPFGWQQTFLVTYATGTGAVGFEYSGIFKQTFGKWDFDIGSYYRGPRYTLNYYGEGNETPLNDNNRAYFRAKANDFFISPGVSRSWGLHRLRIGLQYENVEVLTSQDKFIVSPDAKVDPSVFSNLNFGGVRVQWDYVNVDDSKYKMKGIELHSGVSFVNNLDNTDRQLLRLDGSASIYHTFFKRLTFSHRTGAATLFGEYEFYQANTLGGSQNLRGYWRNRFSGKSDFYQNTELRLRLFDFKGYVVRGRFGVFGFADDGRVWIENDNSSKLHTGYGGGVFLVPYNIGSLTLYYSTSKEANMITLRADFFF